MNTDEMLEALERGCSVRRPSWAAGAYMKQRSLDGLEETYIDGKVVALGFRFLPPEYDDWIIVESAST